MITTNKTGTLNTKAVTASQLATNSPILPHKMNGHYYNVSADAGTREPPALPPRGIPRPGSGLGSNGTGRQPNGKPIPPAVPPKRSSLTRSDLALFSADSVISFIRDSNERTLFKHVPELVSATTPPPLPATPRRNGGGSSVAAAPRRDGCGCSHHTPIVTAMKFDYRAWMMRRMSSRTSSRPPLTSSTGHLNMHDLFHWTASQLHLVPSLDRLEFCLLDATQP